MLAASSLTSFRVAMCLESCSYIHLYLAALFHEARVKDIPLVSLVKVHFELKTFDQSVQRTCGHVIPNHVLSFCYLSPSVFRARSIISFPVRRTKKQIFARNSPVYRELNGENTAQAEVCLVQYLSMHHATLRTSPIFSLS